MIKLEEQEKVVNTRGKNLIVSASAGSGKTTTMIRRVMEIIDKEKVAIDEILVLTYTNSAAEEMKAKLESKFIEKCLEDDRYQKELDKLKTSDISTIHAFCQKMIKKNFYAVKDVASDFLLCDEVSSNLYKNKALKQAINFFKKNHAKDYLLLLEKFSNKRGDKEIGQMIFSLDKFLAVKEDGFAWLNTVGISLYEKKNKEAVYNLFQQYSSLFDEANCEGFDLIDESFEDGLACLKIIIDLYNLFVNYYKNIKKLKNLLDFDDLEHVFLNILQQNEICEKIKNDYKFVFIDEFQDANPIQERILSLLSSDNNRFMVGDVKQSIYGFRMSKPQIFLDKICEYENRNHNSEVLTLNSNFRSDKQILDFVNLVFAKMMTKEIGGVDYANNSMLVGRADYVHFDTSPVVEMILATKEKRQKKSTEQKSVYSVKDHFNFVGNNEVEDRHELQAKMVAEKILHLKQIPVYDVVEKKFRDCQYSDITILVRSRNGIDKLCDRLIECGIPIFANSNSDLMSFVEIKKIVDYLRCCYCQSDDTTFASVLMSELGADLSSEDLAKIKENSQTEKKFTVCVENYASTHNDAICQKIKTLQNEQENFTRLCEYASVFDATKWLIKTKDYVVKMLVHDDGYGKKIRIEKFLTILENKKSFSLCDFVKFFDSLAIKLDCPNFSTGEDEYVKITTIHSSKGLEFPIVILYDSGSELFSVRDASKLKLNDNFGISIPFVDLEKRQKIPTVQEFIISKANKKDEFEEGVRLLYVAMTRAKNKLIICGQVDLEKIKVINFEKDLFSKTNYLDMIFSAFDEETFRQVCNKKDGVYNTSNVEFGVQFYGREQVEHEKKENVQTFSKPDKNFERNILEYLQFQYPHQASVDICLKNSVSSLSFVEGEYSSLNTSPKTFSSSETQTSFSADLGTSYHKVLEMVDFQEVKSLEDVQEQVGDLVKFGKLSKEHAKTDLGLVYSTIIKVKNIIGNDSVIKEKAFIMKVKQSQFVTGGVDDEIIVQGIIDLIAFGDCVTIIDYKLTSSKDPQKIKEKYQRQIDLYRHAIKIATGAKAVNAWIIPIGNLSPIKM